MANNSNKHSAAFSDLLGVTKEWEEITSMFANLLKKQMSESMQAPTNYFSPEKLTLSHAEWKKVWEKVGSKVQEMTNKNMKHFSTAPYSNPKTATPNEDWDKYWKKVMKDTQKGIDKHMKEFGGHAFMNMDNAAPNSDNMANLFSASMLKAMTKMEKLEELKKSYIQDVQDLVQTSTKNAQERFSKSFLEPEAPAMHFGQAMWQNNAAATSLQKLYQINSKFLRECMKI
jgi:hypothetical protein